MKILCVLGEHNYGNPARGGGYEFVNFLPALRNLGHQVIHFESFNRALYRDAAELNRKFLEKVDAEQPDIILTVLLGYEIWLETFELVRAGSRAVLINWSTDDSWKYEQFSRFVSPCFHLYATTYRKAVTKSLRDGYDNFVLTQWAANSVHLAEPLPAHRCEYAVSFVGSAYGNRMKWVADLRQQGIPIECFGFGWPNGAVTAERIPVIMRNSMVSLNFADSGLVMKGIFPSKSRQVKARVFEVPGAGGLLMTESADGLADFYRAGDEICVFGSVADVAAQINHLIQNPAIRDQIAQAGFDRTRAEHTYEARFSQLFELARTRFVSDSVDCLRIDFDKFATIEGRHKLGLWLRVFKWFWEWPYKIIWGRTRGPRAARRFLFELSWRLVGKKTYSVTGWPGRMFYKES